MMTPGSESASALNAAPYKAEADNGFAARSAEAARVTQVFSGDVLPHVVTALQASFNDLTFREMKLESGIVDTINLARDVEDRACTEWNEGAVYSLTLNNNPVQGDDAARFDRTMQVLNYDRLGRDIARGVFRHPGVYVQGTVMFDPNTGLRSFSHVVYTPENFNLVPHKKHPGRYVQVDLYWWDRTEQGEKVRRKRSWTSEEWVECVLRDGKWIETAREPNPYQRIPGRFYRREESLTSLWCDSYGSVLADATIAANAARTVINMQSRGQIKVLGGEFESFPTGQVLRHAGAISFGKGENFNVLDFTTDLKALDDVTVAQERRRALVTCGLPADELDGGGGANESGAARMARYEDRDRMAKARRRQLVAGLREQYWLDLMVLHHALIEGGEPIEDIGSSVDDLAPYKTRDVVQGETRVASQPIALSEQPYRFTVNPREMRYRLTQEEYEREAAFCLQHGLKNRADLYIELIDPDATEDEATAIVQKNLLEAKANSTPGVTELVSVLDRKKGLDVGNRIAQEKKA